MVILEKKVGEAVDVKVELVGGKLVLSAVAVPGDLLDKLKGKIDGGVDDAIIDVLKLVLANIEK